MPRWTDDQQAAIDARGSNLLVSAAAGSGKTAVLVERIIKLIIEDKKPIDKMLIVTFTNAAASEMRERIVGALYEKLETDEKNGQFLRDQIALIGKSYIMTLHSFCIGLVRNNSHFIDLDPGFKVGDTIELNIMAQEVMDELLEEAYEKNTDDFLNFVESYSENRQDFKLQKLIIDTYRFIQSQPEPLDWLEECRDRFKNDYSEYYIEQVKADIKFDLNNALDILETAADICSDSIGPMEYDEMINDDINHIENLKKYLFRDFDEFVKYIRTIKYMRLKSISKARKEEVDPVLVDEVKDLRSNFKSIVDDTKKFFESKSIEDYIKDIKAVEPVVSELYRLVKRYDELYKEKKSDKNLLDFNDLEHFALNALKHEDVKKQYRKKFNYIFLDEYQDSNLVQETLINSIKREDNVFLVGDVKQSIYKFRLADPTLFMSKYDGFSKSEGAANRRIDLKKNFRSRKEVLEGINYIFESLMSKEFGEMTYDKDAMLYPGIDFKEIDNPEIEIKIVEGKYKSEDYDDALNELTTAEIEAKTIVEKIKKLVGTKSYDRKNDKFFDVEYKHIVILLRAVSAWSPIFTEVFTKEGLPIFADSQGGYFDTIEIKMFVDLLKLIDNKLQDLPLLTVLRSPIFNFTTEDLIEIRNNQKKASYFYAMSCYKEKNDNELSEKIVNLNSKLSDWKDKSLYLKLDELLWEIMIDTGYYHYVGAMPGGTSRQANLRLLVDRAEKMEKTSVSGLFNFIQIIDKMKKANSELGTAKTIGENENVVRVMSIHKSKGLEFPVVIIAGMGKKFNLRDSYGDMLLHKKHGLGPKFVDPVHRVYFDTLPKKLIKRAIKFESLSEEMRVLYVALTRAVDKLILVGTVKDVPTASKKWCRGKKIYNLLLGQSYFDWILSILSKHVSSKIIWSLAEKETSSFDSHSSKWDIEIIKRDELYKERLLLENNSKKLESILEDLDSYYDEKTSSMLSEAFVYEYKYKTAHLMPSKLSVSDIKGLKNNELESIGYKFDPLLEKPKFMSDEKELSRAEIGTLTHFILQKTDRHSVETIDSQIDELVNRKIISEEDIKKVDISRVKKFYKSDLGKRYINSKHVYVEKAFVLKKKLSNLSKEIDSEDEVMIQGIIDCYFEEEDYIVLVDYKTDFLLGEDDILKSRYKEQLELYKEAIEKITKKKVKETYIYSLFKNSAILL